jgi:hypothetical protein
MIISLNPKHSSKTSTRCHHHSSIPLNEQNHHSTQPQAPSSRTRKESCPASPARRPLINQLGNFLRHAQLWAMSALQPPHAPSHAAVLDHGLLRDGRDAIVSRAADTGAFAIIDSVRPRRGRTRCSKRKERMSEQSSTRSRSDRRSDVAIENCSGVRDCACAALFL